VRGALSGRTPAIDRVLARVVHAMHGRQPPREHKQPGDGRLGMEPLPREQSWRPLPPRRRGAASRSIEFAACT
jgi:hypothetical protein